MCRADRAARSALFSASKIACVYSTSKDSLRDLILNYRGSRGALIEKLKIAPLTEHFRTLMASRVTLTLDKIGKIIGEPLCASARKYKDYWYRRGHKQISECQLVGGYKISDHDIEKKRVISENHR